ncbi:protein TsetseEP-like [Bactrocera neohumeralis]|uniref:protein TsetseEP-like n=1 Tax=Bactrocera neohumeralis TaxID=98809 RepID=UPI002166964F|nr:protein TsetseEP-like [Bactrocera neohumeralis]
MFKIVLCVLSTILVAECALPSHISARADISLGNFLLAHQGRATTPSSMQCFSLYVPLLTEASNQWAVEYEKCVKAAEDGRDNILEQASSQQKDISTLAGGVCNYVQSCDVISDSLSALDCFGYLSSNTLSTIYTVSNNASDLAATLRQQINLIDVESYRCSNASERQYVERTGQIYTALNFCLENGPPPTIAPPTTSTAATPAPLSAAVNDIQLISAPRRTPLGVLNSQPRSAIPAPRSGLITVLNNSLQQNGDQAAQNV